MAASADALSTDAAADTLQRLSRLEDVGHMSEVLSQLGAPPPRLVR